MKKGEGHLYIHWNLNNNRGLPQHWGGIGNLMHWLFFPRGNGTQYPMNRGSGGLDLFQEKSIAPARI
jgi:hypothetical protein